MHLFERERHVESLDGWLREAAAGGGRLVFVGGEAGVGKTALVDHFCRSARGRARVLRGACDALSTQRPLGPLLDVAAAVGAELDRLLSGDAPRDRVFRATLAELGAGLTPTLVVVEDAHWADEATLDLLRFLGRRLGPVRAIVVVTYRDDEVGPAHPLRVVLGDLATTAAIRRLHLAPLSIDGIRALVAAKSGGTRLDPSAIHRLTGGNPFFASEVLADETAADGRLPATVRDAVLARAARLSPEGREALDAAAVIGSPAGGTLLTEVVGASAAAVEACLFGGMLVDAGKGAFAFRHELARAAIHDAIAPPRRADLHARVLRALETAPVERRDLARLAHHAEEAGDRAAVMRYAPAAARRAAALRAHREAAAQYARALRYATDLPDEQRLSLLEEYADVTDLSGRGTEGIAPREELIALARRCGNRAKEAKHLGWLAVTLALDGRHAAAVHAGAAALAAIEGLPESSAHATAYYHQAHLRLEHYDLTEAIHWGERAIALAERLGDLETLIPALNAVGTARLVGGDERRGRTDLERSLRLAEAVDLEGFVVAALANLGYAHTELYRLDHADCYLTEAIAYATERDLDHWRHWGLTGLALVRLFQGRWTEAEDLAAAVLRGLDAVGVAAVRHTSAVANATAVLPLYLGIPALVARGRVRARRGDQDATAALDEALALAAPTERMDWLAPVRAARAEAAWLAGDRCRTLTEARAAFDLAERHRHPWLVGELAYWRWKAGDLDAPPADAAAPFALAIAGDWRAAAAAWDERNAPYEAARARAEGDDAEALREALATFERLGARPMAAHVAKRLRDLGARGIPRGPRPTTRANPANLTVRELEILPLLAAGRRNAEIAEGLYLSTKTVEHHVGSILAKLGVRARGDTAVAAGRLGIVLAPDEVR
ncbi:MAG TPA: AAA family ATPase [Thermomicrobiales bacterium]|jgi:DNA-binding CsgD family transcriptional regulator